MRKFLLLLSMVIAFIICDQIVARIVGYPRHKLGERTIEFDIQPIDYKYYRRLPPHFKYWNNEDGINSITLNNFGLTGTNLKLIPEMNNIFLLGDSFIEARQYKGESIVGGLLQSRIQADYPDWQVINIGYSGQDPYAQWYRTLYFERYLLPHKVIMIYESFERLSLYFGRWEDPASVPLVDNISYSEHEQLPLQSYYDSLRSVSAFLNLMPNFPMVVARVLKINQKINSSQTNEKEELRRISSEETLRCVLRSLQSFKSKYGKNFYFISIMHDNPHNEELERYCRANGIRYYHNNSIMNPENLIRGSGHLNKQGHKYLAEMIAEIFFAELSQ